MNLPQVKGRLEKDYPLKKLNTWKIGGNADYVFWPQSTDELVEMVRWCKDNTWPAFFLGRGSNVLLPDQGLRAMIIVNTELNKISWDEDIVTVEAGYSLMRLARDAAHRGLRGLEFACGIPGTVGAAIAINAGAYDEEIGNLVEEVTVITPGCEVVKLKREDINFVYRGSSLREGNLHVLNASLRLSPDGESNEIIEKMNGYMAKRRETQPLEYPNAGSVFSNPSGESAGRLIELAGWKGRKIGNAQVSEKHANFIVNLGNAKSSDVLKLIQEIQKDIMEKYKIELITEIRIITG